MNRVDELNNAYKEIEDFRSKLGETVNETFMEEDNYTYEISKSIISVFDKCETERDVEIADSMLIALCGYGIRTLIDKIIWKQAKEQAKEEYEEEWGEGSWEERADKYEREDWSWHHYEKILNKIKKGE
jgi:hypothetical protein